MLFGASDLGFLDILIYNKVIIKDYIFKIMTENLKKITLSDVEKVAGLARLGLSSDEKERLGDQLNDILVYMDKLDELDTTDIEPLAHILSLKNVLREDRVREGLTQSEALKNAPDEKDGLLNVPPVIE